MFRIIATALSLVALAYAVAPNVSKAASASDPNIGDLVQEWGPLGQLGTAAIGVSINSRISERTSDEQLAQQAGPNGFMVFQVSSSALPEGAFVLDSVALLGISSKLFSRDNVIEVIANFMNGSAMQSAASTFVRDVEHSGFAWAVNGPNGWQVTQVLGELGSALHDRAKQVADAVPAPTPSPAVPVSVPQPTPATPRHGQHEGGRSGAEGGRGERTASDRSGASASGPSSGGSTRSGGASAGNGIAGGGRSGPTVGHGIMEGGRNSLGRSRLD